MRVLFGVDSRLGAKVWGIGGDPALFLPLYLPGNEGDPSRIPQKNVEQSNFFNPFLSQRAGRCAVVIIAIDGGIDPEREPVPDQTSSRVSSVSHQHVCAGLSLLV